MREKGNRWYKITVNVVNEEREWSGWIFFLFPHTVTLWYKLLCTPHRLRSWSAEKKAGKRPLKEKIWSKTNVCLRVMRITFRNESYQNQFAVISYLPGPWGFWTLALLQSLFTTNLAVCFPARKALREIETDKYVKGWSFLWSVLMCDCKKEKMSKKQISAHENVSSEMEVEGMGVYPVW